MMWDLMCDQSWSSLTKEDIKRAGVWKVTQGVCPPINNLC